MIRRARGGALADVGRAVPVPALAAVVFGAVLLGAANDAGRPAGLLFAATGALLGAIVGQVAGGTGGALILGGLAAAALGAHEALWISPWLLLGALALGVFVAPLLGRAQTPEAAWRALVRQATAAGLALLGAALVTAGIFAVELSAALLLGLSGFDLAFTVVWPAAFGWLAPLTFLSLSRAGEDDRVAEALSLVAVTFARLVLTPLLAVYTAVLGLYVARVVTRWELPSNEIGWIVPLFATTGALTVLALASRPERGRLERIFLRVWFPVTVGPAVLLALALALRVEEYGITPARYLGLLLCAWIGTLGLVFSLAPRADVRLVPVTLALLAALGAVGPWGLVALTVKSQGDRIAARLPEGLEPVRFGPDAAREEVCSAASVLREVGGLPAVEARLGLAAGALEAACLVPVDRPGVETFNLHTSADTFVWDGRLVWGPVSLSATLGEVASLTAPVSARVDGGAVVVTVDGAETVLDLAGPVRAFAGADPALEGRIGPRLRVSEGRVTAWFASAEVVMTDGRPTVRHAQATLVIEPAPGAPPYAELPAEGVAPRPTPVATEVPRE